MPRDKKNDLADIYFNILMQSLLKQAGACKRMLEIKSDCSAAPACGCEAGECRKTSLPIS
jgi:hypothetical protein